MKNYSQIANLHSDIWFFHDNKRYEDLEKAAFELFKKIGFDIKRASEAAISVKKSYYFYDIAVENKQNKKKYFRKMLKSQIYVLKILNQDFFNICARIHAMWWKEFYLKRKLGRVVIPFLIFLQHALKFKRLNLIPAILCSKFLILAGLKGHNKRNKKITQEYLTDYWFNANKFKLKNNVMY